MGNFMLNIKLNGLKEKFYRKNFLLNHQVGSKGAVIIFFAFILIVSLLYLFQVNSLATKGYEIKDLEEKAAELRAKNKALELQITELRSTERITREIKNLDMVAVARVEYLKANGTSVAIKR